MLQVQFPPSHPHTVLLKQQMLFGAPKKKTSDFESPGNYVFSRAKHILGHLLRFFLGAETFLTPKLPFATVRYHCGGSMELNACILLLAYMVYL
jgi:hypothetical protein